MAQIEVHPATATEAGAVCAICQTAMAEGESIGPCPECAASYHGECWAENGGCAAYGCKLMPATVKETGAAPAAPQSYWGQESKPCPACGKDIKVAAIRCRYCGAAFDSAAPMSRRELAEKRRAEPEKEKLKQTALVVFVTGMLPCTAPLCFIFGGVWFIIKRPEIAKLPVTSKVFAYVGLIVAAVSTVILLLAFVLSSMNG